MTFKKLIYFFGIISSFGGVFIATAARLRDNVIVSEEEITFGDAVRLCSSNNMPMVGINDDKKVQQAVAKHIIAFPEKGFWICYANCNKKDFEAGVLTKKGKRPLKDTLHHRFRAICLDKKFHVRKKRHAHHHHHRRHHQASVNEKDPFSNSKGFNQNPAPNLCVGYRKQNAQQKCLTLRQRHRLFKKCYRTGAMKANFLIMYNQCVLDVCLTGQSQELANLITCDAAETLVKKCRDEGVNIPNWKPVFKCDLTTAAPPQIKQTTPKRVPVCEMKAEAGPCRAGKTRLAFSKKTGTCEPFTYGGCGGNANNFRSFTECIAKCHGEITITESNCPGNQISLNILTNLKRMRRMLQSPTANMNTLNSIPSKMKKVISEFKVFMDLMMQIQDQKTKDAKVLRIRMMENLKAIYLLIESQINERLLFPNNKVLSGSEKVIVRTIDSVKLFQNKKRRTLAGKMSVSGDEKKVLTMLKQILTKSDSKMKLEDMQAIKIFLPTLLLRSIGKMVRAGTTRKGDLNALVTDEKQKFNNIQNLLKKEKKKVGPAVVKPSKTVNLTKNNFMLERKKKKKVEKKVRPAVVKSSETATLLKNA